MRWPIREALEAFRMQLRRQALRAYRHQQQGYYAIAPWSKDARPPELPPILKEIARGR